MLSSTAVSTLLIDLRGKMFLWLLSFHSMTFIYDGSSFDFFDGGDTMRLCSLSLRFILCVSLIRYELLMGSVFCKACIIFSLLLETV